MQILRALAALGLAAGCTGGGDGGDDAGADAPTAPPTDGPAAEPGFRAEYFARYRTRVRSMIEPRVDHAWGETEPVPAAGADRFSARYTATLEVPTAGTYTFSTDADDGVRLWIGDTLVIDDWRGHFAERHDGRIDLAPGPVALRLEYFELDLGAELRLSWTPPGGAEAVLDAASVTASAGIDHGPKPPYANPVLPFDCPDPGVVGVGQPPVYYALCTGGRFPIRRSDDLVMWEDTGAVVLPDGKPPWAANGNRNWAPELHEVGGRFVVYYTSVNAANVLSIGAAVADSPLGPFTDRGGPLVEDAQGVIDASFVRDRDGAPYLVYKIDGNAHGQPTPIYLRRLAADGLSFAPGAPPIELLRNDPASWEGGVVEAPWIIERDGAYFLFYSGNVYDHRYRTGVARAASITGPYTKRGAPLLANDATWVGPGHGSVVAVGARDYFAYHAWHATAAGGADGARGRVVLVDAITYVDGWPRIHDGTPSDAALTWPGE